MKRILIMLALVLGISTLTAQEFTYNGFDFTINDDDVTVTLRTSAFTIF